MPTIGLYRQLNSSNILVSMYRKVRETQCQGIVTSIYKVPKEWYQLIRLLVHIQWHWKGSTRHHIQLWISILWYGQGNYYGSTRIAYRSYCNRNYGRKIAWERLIIVAKLYIFLLKKKSANFFRRSYISTQLVIQCYTMCIHDV